jgi:squalene-associated FAD-dependent desaturase
MKLAVIGAGWAGLAAAVRATQQGHSVTVFEASRTLGGRARAVSVSLPGGNSVLLDNGQHILIGAYSETLQLMRLVGANPDEQLLRLPLTLQYPDGSGLRLPGWPSPLDALGGILQNSSWSWNDKWSLLRAATLWQMQGFRCPAQSTVQNLCSGLTPRVLETLIEPLCVSALNTPAERASAQVFLRVVKDSLFGVKGGSNLLLPKTDLTALFPRVAAAWLQNQGGSVHTASRVESISQNKSGRWIILGTDVDELFDAVLLAGSASATARLLQDSAAQCTPRLGQVMQRWAAQAHAIQFEEIATVYAHAAGLQLAQPLLALHSDDEHPAQFIFDKGQLGGPDGLFAFVVSANTMDRDSVQAKVISQGNAHLSHVLGTRRFAAVQTIVEKRATFACTPGLHRPHACIAPGLLACGDYLEGPYPATLEGAVRSGIDAGCATFANRIKTHKLNL